MQSRMVGLRSAALAAVTTLLLLQTLDDPVYAGAQLADRRHVRVHRLGKLADYCRAGVRGARHNGLGGGELLEVARSHGQLPGPAAVPVPIGPPGAVAPIGCALTCPLPPHSGIVGHAARGVVDSL